jgi:outer membrane protein TolC
VSWPLFDAGRIRANVGIQEASQEEALLAYRGTILFALQEVENALIAYANEQERREHLTRAVEENRRAVELSSELYQRGQVEFLDLLNAQRSLTSSEDALVQSDTTVVTNLIALYKALGGGWDAPTGAVAQQ